MSEGLAGGYEHLVDAHGCEPRRLADLDRVRRVLQSVVVELDLKVVGEPQWHAFPSTDAGPGGVTGLYLLTESHLAVHTYPEAALATFNLYCCRPRRPFPWREALIEALGAREVRVHVVERGVHGGARR